MITEAFWRLWSVARFEAGTYFSHLFAALVALGTTHGVPAVAGSLGVMVVQVLMIVTAVALTTLFMVYAERKVSAGMQARLGPMETGPWGLLQCVADAIKLLFKEDVVPDSADHWLHVLAPMVVVAPVFVCFALIPFGKDLMLINLDTGILFIFAISGVSTIGILMAGWGSGNKYSMLGGIRAAGQLVSYEIPRVLSVVPLLMFYGSQSLQSIGSLQQQRLFGFLPKWFIFYPVIGQLSFVIFFISSVAEANRTPFDLPEAESELVAGFHTEFSGLKFALFFLAEYAYVFLAAAMAVALYFGAGDGFFMAWIPSWFWFLLKTWVLIFVILWLRWTFPRLRVDRLMQLCWQFLLPWALVNIVFTGVWILWRHAP